MRRNAANLGALPPWASCVNVGPLGGNYSTRAASFEDLCPASISQLPT